MTLSLFGGTMARVARLLVRAGPTVQAMTRLVTVFLLLVAAYPAAYPAMAQIMAQNAAQTGVPNGQQQFGPSSGTGAASQGNQSGAGLDVICNEMIAGTFCSSGGSGGGGYGSPTAGTRASNPSLPPCTSGMPANELCN
ncbi:MAG: hypothetical protein WBE48_14125 [Xanthobacteraceae bacterium]